MLYEKKKQPSTEQTGEKPRIETEIGGEGNEIDLDQTSSTATGKPASGIDHSHTPTGNEVFIMDKSEDRTASFFAQPGILAGTLILITFHYFYYLY